jgi:hypothetical protein
LTRARAATVGVMGLRIAYGVGLIGAPSRLGRRWLGPASQTAPTQVPLQALGMREAALHTGAAWTALRGGALRPWLAGSIAGDLTDIVTTIARRGQLPQGAAMATAVVGGSSALLTALLYASVDC